MTQMQTHAETADDLTVNYTEGGVQRVRELDKVVLTRGSWTTVLFKYCEWDGRREEFGPVRFSIRRYQKRSDRYQQRSKFTISSADQARKIIGALEAWLAAEGDGGEAGGGSEAGGGGGAQGAAPAKKRAAGGRKQAAESKG